jgi:hypothetical protein
MFCDKEINGAKSRVMCLHQASDLRWNTLNAINAARSSNEQFADILFIHFRVVRQGEEFVLIALEGAKRTCCLGYLSVPVHWRPTIWSTVQHCST